MLALLAAACAQCAAGKNGDAEHAPLSVMRLLLVEDNELNQIVARGILEGEGMTVQVAGNGQEALEVLARDSRFDLILMDVQMPVLDGLAATRLIRSELKLTVPVIAMSASVLSSERERCLEAGMNDFVAKPIDSALLFATLQRHAPPGTVRTGAAAGRGRHGVRGVRRASADAPERARSGAAQRIAGADRAGAGQGGPAVRGGPGRAGGRRAG
ncbi:response regulator [Massilia sp. B-10]|nr:response regulator [Massilia sp. B-10]